MLSATALYFSFSVRKTTSGFSRRSSGLLVGNDDDLELVNLLELGRFGLGRARHAAQLLIKAEIILEGDRGQRLVFLADVHAFLGLDGLVQPVAPAASRHQAAGEGVHDNHLAVLHHVVHIALVKRVRLDGRLDVVLEFPVFRVGNVADAQRLLDRLPALVRHADGALLLVHNVVAGQVLLALAQPDAQFLLPLCVVHSTSSPSSSCGMMWRTRCVLVRRLVGGAGDNQRRPRFVDQDRVHLVDDRVVVPALHAILDLELHVVAQVVEAEFVIRPVGDVGAIRGAALIVVRS